CRDRGERLRRSHVGISLAALTTRGNCPSACLPPTLPVPLGSSYLSFRGMVEMTGHVGATASGLVWPPHTAGPSVWVPVG
ncbi:Hypothetical predicted protein, partial [Pelobates cultripes]